MDGRLTAPTCLKVKISIGGSYGKPLFRHYSQPGLMDLAMSRLINY